MKGNSLHKKHNAEDVRLKARPMGRSPKARLCVIAFHHAMSMLSKQCLDSGFWAAPEFMIIGQSCLKYYHKKVRANARTDDTGEFMFRLSLGSVVWLRHGQA